METETQPVGLGCRILLCRLARTAARISRSLGTACLLAPSPHSLRRKRNGKARTMPAPRSRSAIARDDYVNRVRVAAQDLVARGLLLSDDAAVIIQSAASSNLFGPAPANSASR